jgi:hypothetical protein
MPSQLHEALLLLFRNRPQLAPELLRDALQMSLPNYTDVRIDSADLTEVQPAEYRADLVLLLSNSSPVLGIVVEVQLSVDERKRYVWPAYVANLRARLECQVYLLVIAADATVGRWAAKPVDLGDGNRFTPRVIGPEAVPEITDETQAAMDPELAVLSAMAHGCDVDSDKAARIAAVAQRVSDTLDEDRSKLYFDLIINSLSEAARRALQFMRPIKYEYQSDFAKRYVAQGRAEGRADMLMRLLKARFGPLSTEVQAQIAASSSKELDAIAESLLTASSLQEALLAGSGADC